MKKTVQILGYLLTPTPHTPFSAWWGRACAGGSELCLHGRVKAASDPRGLCGHPDPPVKVSRTSATIVCNSLFLMSLQCFTFAKAGIAKYSSIARIISLPYDTPSEEKINVAF